MEKTGEFFNIQLTLDELIKFIPSKTWESMQQDVLNEANTKYKKKFDSISWNDSEGTIDFGISD
jgi:hypothetical protein